LRRNLTICSIDDAGYLGADVIALLSGGQQRCSILIAGFEQLDELGSSMP
jgi:hypothetical protein